MQGKRVLKKQKQQSNYSQLGTYFVSLFSVLLCFAMLLGTTFALFYTSDTSAGNEINSGRLKVDMIHLTSGGEVSLREDPKHEVFSQSTKWRPGVTQKQTLRICNVGNVDLKYKLDFVPDSQHDVAQTVSSLFSVYVRVGDAAGWTLVGTLDQVMNSEADCCLYAGSEVLRPGKEQLISIELRMEEPDNPGAVMGQQIFFDLEIEAIQPTGNEE